METEKERAARYAAKPRVQKLGVKEGMTVAFLAVTDATIRGEVDAAGARVARGARRADIVFLQADAAENLERIRDAAAMIPPAGAVWVLTPRQTRGLAAADVIAAGKAAGLVDVKVVRFNDTHTSLKFVVPKAMR